MKAISMCYIPGVRVCFVLIVLLSSSFSGSAYGQDIGPLYPEAVADSSQLWRVVMRDRNEFFGYIVGRTDESIQIQTDQLGEITISFDQIRTLEPIEQDRIVQGELWAENSQATRYFWGPNGYGLRRGKGYYQNVWVFFNQLSVGITDNTSLGIGMVPLFLFEDSSSPVWITPKVSFPLGKKESMVHVGVGALVGTVLREDDANFGVLYGAFTVGTRDRNFNIGLGYAYADGEFASEPTLSISAMYRGGRRSYLLFESFLINDGVDTSGLVLLGGRLVGRSLAFDYGLLFPLEEEASFDYIIPWIGISVPVGR